MTHRTKSDGDGSNLATRDGQGDIAGGGWSARSRHADRQWSQAVGEGES